MSRIILIVEDSEPCVTTLELALLNLDGLEILTARTVKEALGILASDTNDVRAIVTDLNLPHMNGFELIKLVRARSDLPILVTSGDSDPANSERLRHLGANAYFIKPYSPAAVRRTLEHLLHAT